MHSNSTIHELTHALRQKLTTHDRPIVVTISGPSGSGKTTIVHQLIEVLHPPVALVNTDDYYIGKTRMKTEMPNGEALNFDHPASLNLTQLANTIACLREGNTVESPIYDMATSEPTSKARTIHPARLIIVEGVVANLDDIRILTDISVCVTAPVEVRLQRSIVRDASRNLRSESDVREHFENNVIPSYKKYFLAADTKAMLTIQS